MSLLELPTEIILLIVPYLSESDLAHIIQVHRFLYNLLLQHLYQRHLKSENRTEGLFRCTVTGNLAGIQHFLHYGADVNAFMKVIIPRRRRREPFQLWYSVKNPLDIAPQNMPFRPERDVLRMLNIAANTPFRPWNNLQSPLNIAANIGNDALVSLLLSHGASVYGFPNSGRRTVQPAAVDAILSGHESTVRLLLEHSSPMQDPDLDLGGLVNWAICRGQVSILKLLVEFGADFNIPHEGMYPLNRAVSSGNLSTEIVRFLLDNGANIRLANGHAAHLEGDTGRLLDEAIEHGTIDTLRLLFDRGLETPPKIYRPRIQKCTIDVVRLLLEHGFVPDIDTLKTVVAARRGDILQLFIDTGVDLNIKSERGSTLLHTAIVRCRYSPNGTVTHRIACFWRRPPPLIPILRRKIETAPQQVSERCVSDDVETCSSEDIVRCLIRGGADLNALNAQGLTPLALAEKGPSSVQQLLVDSGAK